MVTKEQMLEQIEACREQVHRLLEIAPDAVPTVLRALVIEAESTEKKLDQLLGELENDESREAFVTMVTLSIKGMTESLAKFEAQLRERMQPAGMPRVKRKFKNFRKRRGEW